MKNNNTPCLPPVAIHFIWNIADSDPVDGLLDFIRLSFARDTSHPFSRGLNIPLFFYNSNNPTFPPKNKPEQQAEKDIMYIFASQNTLGYPEWSEYISNLPETVNFKYIPLALDHYALSHSSTGVLKDLNFIRLYELSPGESYKYNALLKMAHELYRFGFVEIDENAKGIDTSITIFLSHCKIGKHGESIAKEIKSFIDNTNMKSFFDSTGISPGFNFTNEIDSNIKNSTVLAIECDEYYSRYWCQKEIIIAKQKNLPIVVLDCLKKYEDRIFPFSANVPCISLKPQNSISNLDLLSILLTVLLETIRHKYALELLKYYRNNRWIPQESIMISRPPEAIQIKEWNEQRVTKVCYPEPPLYKEEVDLFIPSNINVFTPLWGENGEALDLNNVKIGISISDCKVLSFSEFHLHSDNLKRLSQDIARHLLAREGTIIYGGDLRNDGFTKFILDEAIILKSRLQREEIHVENYLAWPLYISSSEIVAWRAKYNTVMNTIHSALPNDIKDEVNKDSFLAPNDAYNKYIWSRSLTHMREQSIPLSDFRICAGGKLSGYKGKMPGVLEEIMISIELKKPIYLLGAFGGVVGEVCFSILNSKITKPLTEPWQNSNNRGYSELQKKAKENKHQADFDNIKTVLEELTVEELSQRAGLSKSDYSRLMKSPFTDECVHLILKGLKESIKNRTN